MRCGSNNLPGQTQCWRCGSSLPPPEELASLRQTAHDRAAIPARDSQDHFRRANARPRIAVAAVVIAAAIGIGALMVRAWRIHTTPSAARAAAELNAIKDRLLRERGLAGSDALTQPRRDLPQDPLEAQARREIERLQRQLGERPALGPESDVRLRTGGVMPRGEYERRRRDLDRRR